MKVEPIKLEYKNPLVNKYLYDFASVGELFAANPHEIQSFKKRQQTVLKEFNTDREELVRILMSYNKEMGCGLKTEENINLLQNSQTQVVITGQQAGIFSGPLYTIYKIITVIQLAQEKSVELESPVVPFFWVASEDHDFLEIDHLDFINQEGELERLRLEQEPEGKFSIGDIPVTDAVFNIIDDLAEKTNPSEWKNDFINRLKDYAGKSDNLADWFARIISELFTDYGLILISPMLPGIRQLMGPIFERFINSTDKINEAFQKGQQRVTDLGFSPQVDKSSDNVHLFRYIDGERLPIFQEDLIYKVRGRDVTWTKEQLIETAKNSPQEFSPNVVLRPVAQDYILPLLAYVAGPGEISYYALYKDIYPLFDMSMPIIYPRANITLLEGNMVKLLRKYDLTIQDIFDGLDEKLKDYLKELEVINIDAIFGRLRQEVSNLYKEVGEQVKSIDPNLPKTGKESLNKVQYQINYYYDKVQQGHRKKNEVVTRRFEKISTSLYPKGNYQERVFNIYQYLFKYGPDLIKDLVEQSLIKGVDHKFIYL